MNRLDAIRHEFVEFIPDSLEPGVVYVSIPYATTAHLCCCGCGSEAVNPLAPHSWRLTFDGQSITLNPSIGNWSFACQSHYWIRNDQVEWAGSWSREKIDAGREARRREIDRPEPTSVASSSSARSGRLAKLRQLFRLGLG